MNMIIINMGKSQFLVSCLYVVAVVCATANVAQDVTTVLANTNVTLSCGRRENVSWTWIPMQTSMENLTSKRWTQNRSSLLLQGTSFADSGKYTCLDGTKNVVKVFKVMVADPPAIPQNLSCETDHVLDFMTCCWNNGPYSGINTLSTLHYTRRRGIPTLWLHPTPELEIEGSGSCIEQHNQNYSHYRRFQPLQCCQIPTDYKPNKTTGLIQFDIQIKSENVLGKVTVNTTELPFNWIRPIPPRNLRAHTQEKGNSYFVTVSWDSPNMTIDSFIYELRYRVSPDQDWHTLGMIEMNEKTFEVRRSFSVIEIQLSAQPYRPFGGFYSAWTPSVFTTTGVIAPFSRMRFQNIVCDLTENGLLITSYWIEYTRPDEPGFYVEIKFTHCNGNVAVAANISDGRIFFTASIHSSDCLKVSGSYCNVVGCSKATVVDIHASLIGRYKAVASVQISNGALVGSWRSTDNHKTSSQCAAKIMTSHREKINGSEIIIRNTIREQKKVPCQGGNITIYDQLHFCREYYLVVGSVSVIDGVTYTRTYRSPLRKSSANITKPFTWNVTSTVNAGFRISSQPPIGVDCSNFRPRIFYKPINGSECSGKNGTCRGNFISQPLECENNGSIVEGNVFGDTTYELEIASCCSTELSSDTGEPICFESPSKDIKLIKTPIKAPGPPFNFRWLDTQKVVWDPPRHKNGPIVGYIISTKRDGELKNVTAHEESIEYLRLCHDSAKLNGEIRAFTASRNGKILFGIAKVLPKNLCTGKNLKTHSVSLVAVSVFGIIAVVIATTIAAYHRRKMKHILSRTIWPRIPRPNLIIAFHGGGRDRNSDGFENTQHDSVHITAESARTGEERYDEIHTALLGGEEPDRSHTDVVEYADIERTSSDENQTQRTEYNEAKQSANFLTEYALFSPSGQSEMRTSDEDTKSRQERCHSFTALTTPISMERTPANIQNQSVTATPVSVPINSQLSRARQQNSHASLGSIPSYLSCSTTRIHSPIPSSSKYPNCQLFDQNYSSSSSENYAFFDASWSGLPQCSSALVVGPNPHSRIFLSETDAETNHLWTGGADGGMDNTLHFV